MKRRGRPKTALFVAAGTGGHLYPAIATARALIAQAPWSVTFAVRTGDMGRSLLEREGFAVIELPGQGLPRRPSPKLLTFPVKTIAGFLAGRQALNRLDPSVVVGWGGYLSFAVLLMARLQHRKTMVHEQNVLPGLTNKIVGRFVDRVAVSFPESKDNFPVSSVFLSGLPVRTAFANALKDQSISHFGLEHQRLTFLVFGGSLGAHRLNEAVVQALPRLSDRWDGLQIIHITGTRDYETIAKTYAGYPVKSVVLPYCHDMALAFGAADLILCRAGASTVAELGVAKKPSILVPYPFASENHQLYNAEVLVKLGAAEVLFDDNVTPESVAIRLRTYLKNPERLVQMSQRILQATGDLHASAAETLSAAIRELDEGSPVV